MNENYEKLFTRLPSPEPPAGLFQRTLLRLEEERKLAAVKRRLALFSVGLLGSIVALVPVFKMVYAGFAESGFIKFLSLIISDTGIVAAYWQNFALSLLETLPAMSLILLLAVVLVFLELLKLSVKNLKFIFVLKQLIHN
ncbi:MAG: hypothetical protein PHD51_00640 [Patescibacteria group bacterium]|nr:hypothetical protein [Patescibacteria group bacterium]MDD5490626.1 hypothetical protein [Patescibacteria group bacterium]